MHSTNRTMLDSAYRAATRHIRRVLDAFWSPSWPVYRDHRKPIRQLQAPFAPGRESSGRLAALAIIALLAAPPVSAAELQSHESIRAAARHYLEETPPGVEGRIEFTIGHLDPRLRLQQCATTLEVFPPPGGRITGRSTLGVRCQGPKPWKLYLPVAVNVYRPVAAARHALIRGEVLTEEDIQWVEKDVSRLGYGYIVDVAQAAGMAMRRSATAGTVLTPNHLAAPRIVQRGQTVAIIAAGGGIEVRMAGEALSDGALNDRIRVRNSKTRRIVEGVVSAPGVVEVPL